MMPHDYDERREPHETIRHVDQLRETWRQPEAGEEDALARWRRLRLASQEPAPEPERLRLDAPMPADWVAMIDARIAAAVAVERELSGDVLARVFDQQLVDRDMAIARAVAKVARDVNSLQASISKSAQAASIELDELRALRQDIAELRKTLSGTRPATIDQPGPPTLRAVN
jgi:hypothetical protein